jgi:hypothetical protein
MTSTETQSVNGRKTPNRWFALAEDLQARLKKVGSGLRESAISEFGQEHGLKADTLRAYLMARRHIESLATQEPDLAQALRTAPVDAVTALARWSQADNTGSVVGARKVAAGQMSINQAKRAAADARGAGVRGSPKLTFVARILSRRGLYWWKQNLLTLADANAALEHCRDTGESWTKFQNDAFRMGGKLTAATTEVVRSHRVDLFAGDAARRVAILVVGPYQLSKYYTKLHIDWLLLAIGVSYFYNNVALFFPPEGIVRPFQRWMRLHDPEMQLSILLVRETLDGDFQEIERGDLVVDGTSDDRADADTHSEEEEAVLAAFRPPNPGA